MCWVKERRRDKVAATCTLLDGREVGDAIEYVFSAWSEDSLVFCKVCFGDSNQRLLRFHLHLELRVLTRQWFQSLFVNKF